MMLRQTDIEEKKFKQLSIAKSIELKLIALDFDSGEMLQTIDLINFEQPDAIHTLNNYASPTPVINGDRIYCHFGNYKTFCLDHNSFHLIWKRRLPLQHSVGPGSSPLIHKNRLILIQDGLERQYITALNKNTGETI